MAPPRRGAAVASPPRAALRSPALVLYARVPRLGAVKTRTVPPLSETEALALHGALLLDSLALLRRAAGAVRGVPILAFSEPWRPAAGDRDLAAAAAGLPLVPQRGGDLGERLSATFDDLLERGHDGVVIFGSDSPTLPVALLAEACAALAGRDAAIGPAEDGGFYLIGATRPIGDALRGVAWGSSTALRDALAGLRLSGRVPAVLPPWYDIDCRADLDRLARGRAAGAPLPPRTAAWLARFWTAGPAA